MFKRIPIKNHQHEIQLITQRAFSIFFIFCILITLLIVRLVYLQVHKHDIYTTLSTKNWLDLVPVEPTRGLIYDRRGNLLAENIPVFSLDLIPFQIVDLKKTLNQLGKIITLSESDLAQFHRQIKQHRRFDEIPLKLRLTDEEVARFTENQHNFHGVRIKARLMRHYPFAESFSHVIGYVGRINSQELNEIDQTNYSASHYIGKLGIEKFYEEELHGKVGYQQVENDASGKPIRILKELKGTPGKNIYLTIDSGLQFIAEKALQGHRGAIVAIEPETGQVLAMVSKPGYDPNIFVLGINHKDYQVLQTSKERPLYNRALRGLYPLASTIKPYLALEAIDAGLIDPEENFYDQGWFRLHPNSHVFHDWAKLGHGYINFNEAMTFSCDTYFYDLANKLGIKRINNILSKFGFGTLSGIDLDNEISGVVASPEWKLKIKGTHWYEGDTINSGIGQGYMQATPLQLAVATATLANRGARLIPYLLRGMRMPDDSLVLQHPIALETISLQNSKTWDVIIKAMHDVITAKQGTGFRFGNATYTIAAKTGTGQIFRRRNPDERDKQENLPEKLRDHHLFIAFAPIENPKIALAIVSENSNIVVEAARTILDYYLDNKNEKNTT